MDIYRIRTNNKTSSQKKRITFIVGSITVQQIVEFDHEIGAKTRNSQKKIRISDKTK